VKTNKIILLGSLISGLMAYSSLFAQEFLPPAPAAPKVRLCIRMQGDDPELYMRKFSYMLSGNRSAADFFRLEGGQRLYVADLDVSQPGLLKIEEDGNANFNCTFPIRPDTQSIDITIHSPPGVQDCSLQTFTRKQACHL
jgi:hypothetical protein